MKYQALLRLNDLIRFLNQFNGLESAKKTEISISSLAECDEFAITLTPKGNCTYLLPQDFRDGLLYIRGWNEKFTRL